MARPLVLVTTEDAITEPFLVVVSPCTMNGLPMSDSFNLETAVEHGPAQLNRVRGAFTHGVMGLGCKILGVHQVLSAEVMRGQGRFEAEGSRCPCVG